MMVMFFITSHPSAVKNVVNALRGKGFKASSLLGGDFNVLIPELEITAEELLIVKMEIETIVGVERVSPQFVTIHQ